MRAGGAKSLRETVYRDVPIVRVASALTGGDPPEYRLMRKLGVTLASSAATEAVIFYEQGRFMEHFTDDSPYDGDFVSFYPTYRSMSYSQLRGYFTWRAAVRRGEILRGATPYAYVYIYELLNLIGCKDAEDAFIKLSDFYHAYRSLEPTLDRYVKPWLRDMVIYYNLPREYLAQTVDLTFDTFLYRLMHFEDFDDESLFEAITSLSTFRAENSRFYREYPDDVRAVACRVYRTMGRYFAAHRKTSYCEALFGRLRAQTCIMFASAVFYDRKRHENRRYEIGRFYSYACFGGRWTCYRFAGGMGKSTALGAFLRSIDALMRTAVGYAYETKSADCTKQFLSVAKKEIDAFLAEKQAAEARRVEIDLSALDAIRSAADETCEKLLTQEELATAEDTAPGVDLSKTFGPAALQALPAEEPEHDGFSLLTQPEAAFLTALLRNEDPVPALRKEGLLLSVAAESVNEKLFETFMDNVIIFDADVPQIEPYYLDALKERFLV